MMNSDLKQVYNAYLSITGNSCRDKESLFNSLQRLYNYETNTDKWFPYNLEDKFLQQLELKYEV